MRTLTLLVLVLVAACTVPPPEGPTPRAATGRIGDVDTGDASTGAMRLDNVSSVQERSFQAPVATVWQALMATYNALEIPVSQIAAEKHQLVSQGVKVSTIGGKRMSTWLDCGSSIEGDRADTYTVFLSLVSSVSAAEGGGSELVVDLDASAQPRMAAGSGVHCTSRATLEARVFEEVGRQLGGERSRLP